MIFSENRCALFGIMLFLFEHDLFRKPLRTFRDHALAGETQLMAWASSRRPAGPCLRTARFCPARRPRHRHPVQSHCVCETRAVPARNVPPGNAVIAATPLALDDIMPGVRNRGSNSHHVSEKPWRFASKTTR